MNKKYLLAIIACFGIITASTQTLFTYGKYAVDVKEFLRAYKKNNTTPVFNKAKAVNDYLDLYINSKLKVRDGYNRRYDTLSYITTELEGLREQIADNYMNNPEIINRMQKESFERSQKDIRVAHIFIAFKNERDVVDTAAANLKKNELLKNLQKGDDFLQVAKQASDDPAAKTSLGEIGYITVFTLPYEFENAVYNTPVGKYSSVITSKAGYHIFKNLGERKAAGKMKAQQILLAFPPGADDAAKKRLASLADSLYKRIMTGDNFNQLATAFSSDYVTAANGGTMPDISVGQYDPVFEKTLWALPKDGAVSKPFSTTHGWHIVKRTSLKPIVTDINDKSNLQDLLTKIQADTRSKSSQNFIYNTVMEKGGYKKHPYNETGMRAMTDSILDLKPMTEAGRTIRHNTPLFSIGDSVYTTNTWLFYAFTHRFNTDGSGMKPYEQVWEEFLQFAFFNHYRSHLEEFNDEFRCQMMEFKDGNIFFEIMQQEIWNKGQNDNTALLALYEKNKKNYIWNQSADAVMFFCGDETTANKVYEEIKKKPADWRKTIELYSEKVVADSARYEWSQIPNLSKITPKAGIITSPLVNTNDNTASFAYIVQSYPQPMQRTFNESKGLVIADYQVILEKEWTENLRKKYPIVIDKKVLNDILK